MNTKIMTIAFLAITVVTSQLVAQEAVSKSAGYDLKKNVKARVTSTETGYTITFEYDAKSTSEALAGKPLSKKGYDYYLRVSEYNVSSKDNSVTEVNVASGMPTEKRQHQPIGVKTEIDKSTPILYKSSSSTGITTDGTLQSTGGGAGKATFKEFTITKRCGGESTKYTLANNEFLIPIGDCPNGACDLKIEWTWNDGTLLTDIGSSGMDGVSRSSANFSLTIEDGSCTAMAINEKGLPGEKNSPKTKPKN